MSTAAVAPISYKLQNINLAERWLGLVRAGSVSASTEHGEAYGVTEVAGDLRFFVRGATEKAQKINATLAASGDGLRVATDGPFVAQLQLSRTLRPAPAFATGGGFDETSYTPPSYEPGSLVVGPLRLQDRPRAAALAVHGRAWDCYHNVAPCDPRGHFLLLPAVGDQKNWRPQRLTAEDCADLCGVETDLALVFNSIGAGASQNHVHAHAWPAPPVGAARYAVEGAAAARSTSVGGVEVELLDYPLCAVRLRGEGRGEALGRAVAAVEARHRPHNVAVLGGAAYVFARRAERSPQLAGRLGAAECLGVFHCTSEEDFDRAAAPGTMAAALAAVSAPAEEVWGDVVGTASGGGRCNVIHDPTMAVTDIVERYPRGRREIRGPFTSLFGPDDMRRWFEAEGVELKTEADGRVFPVTDDSQTVADALRNAAHKAGVLFKGGAAATTIDVAGDGFAVKTGDDAYDAAAVVLATGSAPGGYALAKALGHEPVKPCPSLFSFRVKSPVLEGLAGLSVPDARVELKGAKKKPPPPTRGPLLVTHRGLSGPAALRLSAFKARELQDCGYKGTLVADLLPDASPGAVRSTLDSHKKKHAGATVAGATRPFSQLPKRLWARLVAHANVRDGCRWGDASARELDAVAAACSALELPFDGKDTNKEEFVTAGGVRLKEINFKTYESKSVPGLHFCGELVDVDGVTGGFNFMHCWCSGFAAGTSAADIAEGVS